MPRPRLKRRVHFQPDITYFKPAGVAMAQLNEVVLTVDEFEALRLKDFLNLDQSKAAKKMKISQPTFHRLISSARKRVAEALVKGNAIKIEGGVYKMVQSRGRGLGAVGAGRGTGMGRRIGMGAGRGLRQGVGFGAGGRGRMGGPLAAGPSGVCVCPKCGYKEPQIRGQPCVDKKCPKCKCLMVRRQ